MSSPAIHSSDEVSMRPAALDAPQPALIRRIANGDRNALAALYDETRAAVYGVALRILRDPADAEEVTLDVYLQAWRQAGRFDSERGAPIAWLLMLARSRAIDRLRSRGRSRETERPLELVAPLPSAEVGPDAAASLGERGRFVRAALASLPVKQREVIELAYLEGLSQSELAARLRLPLGTIKTRTRAALARLRESLTGLEATA